ncbi:putative reverse transcriptase domain-containing protein [Tanacetum coccineum]
MLPTSSPHVENAVKNDDTNYRPTDRLSTTRWKDQVDGLSKGGGRTGGSRKWSKEVEESPRRSSYTDGLFIDKGTDMVEHPASRQVGIRPNQAMAIEGGQGRGNNGNPTRGRAFMMGAEEARQDPNIMTGTFTLNNHYATILFDYSADYSFVSTTFIPLLSMEPSRLGFTYEIEIASGQLVEINKVIRGCKLEIEGHTFDINLIPFGHRSFNMIVGMD